MNVNDDNDSVWMILHLPRLHLLYFKVVNKERKLFADIKDRDGVNRTEMRSKIAKLRFFTFV